MVIGGHLWLASVGMNGWDLFTWIMIFVLAGGATGVFLFFLADLRSVLRDIGRRE